MLITRGKTLIGRLLILFGTCDRPQELLNLRDAERNATTMSTPGPWREDGGFRFPEIGQTPRFGVSWGSVLGVFGTFGRVAASVVAFDSMWWALSAILRRNSYSVWRVF